MGNGDWASTSFGDFGVLFNKLFGAGEGTPWLAELLSMILADDPNVGRYFRQAWRGSAQPKAKTSPWEELQDIVETAQTKETVTHPSLNPLIQQYFPDYVEPHQFSFEELKQRKFPQDIETLMPFMRDLPQDVRGFQFETRPGEIFRPELPARVRAPEVLEKKQAGRIDRFIEQIKAEDFLKAREELDKLLGDKKIPFGLFKALPEGMKKQMYPKLYPEEGVGKPPAAVQKSQRALEFERLDKIVQGAKTKGLEYIPFEPQKYERYRELSKEFGAKEEKPPKWTTTFESAYGRRDAKLEGHMTRKQWNELSPIGKPISKIPSQETLLQRNAIVSDLSDLGKKADPSEKNALLEERRTSLENERQTLEAMGINVDYLLKYLNTFKF